MGRETSLGAGDARGNETTPTKSIPAHPEYVVTLRALPSSIPAAVRLRHVLKRLLRTYSMRCTSIVPASMIIVVDDDTTTEKGGPH